MGHSQFLAVQLGHTYPSSGAPLSEQVIIDLSENPKELSAADGDVYPLIFRLETISDKGLADGHVLEVLPHNLNYSANNCFCPILQLVLANRMKVLAVLCCHEVSTVARWQVCHCKGISRHRQLKHPSVAMVSVPV